MLQSSIYPKAYGVPSEYFFVIKFMFEPTPDLEETIKLTNIHLDINDRVKDNVKPVDRKLNKNEGILLNRSSEIKQHNILIYLENLKASVTGYIEYEFLDSSKNEGV